MGKFSMILRVAIASAVVSLATTTLSVAADPADKPPSKGTVHTVLAAVDYPVRGGIGIQAELQPGEFSIPQGSLGTKLKYSFTDLKTDFSSTKLRGNNIYSVTAKRYLRELDNDLNFSLPPGKYKFVVGGLPGARGTLTYTLVDGVQDPPPPDGTIGTTVPVPPPTEPPSTKPPEDQATAATMRAMVGSWSGTYTVEKITGDVAGLGTVQGKRALGIKVARDGGGLQVTGMVWIPPGWNGRAGGMNVSGNSVWFNVTGQQMADKKLVISFQGTCEANDDAVSGTLLGFLTQGDTSREVFQGSWKITRK